MLRARTQEMNSSQSRDALKTKIPPKVNYKSELLKTFFFFFFTPKTIVHSKLFMEGSATL